MHQNHLTHTDTQIKERFELESWQMQKTTEEKPTNTDKMI
jgi:hypothetical protein